MSILFDGAYANPETQLWLSALGPNVSPNNLVVSTITVNPTGGIAMRSDGAAYPATDGAPVAFNRVDNASATATQLQQIPSKDVPTKAAETTYLASTEAGGFSYDDIAMAGLQIYGTVPTAPASNSGCAGYLTQGAQPFSIELYTGNFRTPVINTNTINAAIGVFSTINVSTGQTAVPDPLNISSINVSTINAGNSISNTATISSLIASQASVSTLNVSSFTFNTLVASTITAGVGTFSTLNAPGFSGGGAITASTIASSTITTGLVSTATAVIKEAFASTLVFNASVSPKVDLGLGGLIGGLIGGATSNTLSLAIGAANLATGIGILAQARQSGGLTPGVFQTINGTSQLQFSTLNAVTPTTFVLTDSLAPGTTPGNPISTQTFIPAGSYCVRTVSDPLNLLNASGAAGEGIQGFSQWEPIFPGYVQVKTNSISSIINGNTIYFGTVGEGLFLNSATGNTTINTQLLTSSIIANGNINATNVIAPTVRGTAGIFSTLNVSTFNIGTVGFNNLTASTLSVAGLTSTQNLLVTNQATVQNLSVNGNAAIVNGLTVNGAFFGGTVTGGTSLAVGASGNLSVPNTGTISSFTVSSINGVAYIPAGGAPTGTVTAYAGQSAPAGYLLCDGTSYNQLTYPALFGVIGINYGQLNAGFFSVPDLRTRTVFGASLPAFVDPVVNFNITCANFNLLQTRYSGTNVPNGTNGNGQQALGVISIAAGFELRKGMLINATTGGDTTFYSIVELLNYPGGSGFYTWPNFPVIILNAAMTANMSSDTVFEITSSDYIYKMTNGYAGNLITQTQTQVGNHSHPANGGTGGGVGTSGSSNPIQGTNTGAPNNNHYYAIGASTLGAAQVPFNIPTSMPVVPNFLAMNYIIKT